MIRTLHYYSADWDARVLGIAFPMETGPLPPYISRPSGAGLAGVGTSLFRRSLVARQIALVRIAVPLSLLAVVAGCGSGDAHLKSLAVGISKDSVVKLMGVEKPQRVDPYLTNGHYIEAMYYRKPGQSDSVPDRNLSPVVVIDGKLVGWGWKTWDSIAGANKIQVAK
jgi:hypothetical protein